MAQRQGGRDQGSGEPMKDSSHAARAMAERGLGRWRARRWVVLIMASLLCLVVVSACGSEGSGDSGAAGNGPAGQLVIAHPFPISALDLTGPLSGDRAVLTINRQLFDALTRLDDATGNLQPWLAKSWETVDETTWKFSLRDDVKFHDGTPLTAKDVKATVDTLIKAATPLAPIFDGVTSVEAPDDVTVLFHSERPLGALPRNVALLGIAPADRVGKDGFFDAPVGSGKFKFDSFTGDELVLLANSEHWNGPPKAEKLVFRQIPDATARVAALQTGEIDITWNIPPDLLAGLKSTQGVTTATVPGFLNYEILINWDRPSLDNLKVRQALVHAIDANSIIKNVLGGLGTPARAPLAQTIFGATELEPHAYDPALAGRLLQESGANNVELKMLLRPQELEEQVALAIISQWAKVGIKVKPEVKELAAWTDDYVALNFDLALTIRPTLTGDADYTLGRLYTSSAKRVPCASQELDESIEAGAGGTDDAARLAAYKEALGHIWTNVCGIYPIDVQEAYGWTNRVSGFVPAPSALPVFDAVSVTS
jgi:peptide/nickel transport system substrate-binding protein